MDSGGKPGAGFPPLPTALGNRCRDSHIPAAPARGGHGEAEIQKQDSHFPTAIPSLSKLKKRKEINPRLIPCFQAHLWIRKRCGRASLACHIFNEAVISPANFN